MTWFRVAAGLEGTVARAGVAQDPVIGPEALADPGELVPGWRPVVLQEPLGDPEGLLTGLGGQWSSRSHWPAWTGCRLAAG